MSTLAERAVEMTARLQRLSTSGGAPAKARRSAAALAARLAAPVRIGILGLPGAGQCALLGGLTGATLADVSDLPPLEVSHGDAARVEAMLADGTMVAQDGPLRADMLARNPVFLRLALPEPALLGRQVLLVTAPPSDLPAALAWAAERADICLWCSSGWHPAEAAIWQAAPERLTHHAVLISDGPATDGFEAAFAPRDLAGLSAHLDRIVEEAAAQDLLAAEMILQRHGGTEAPETLVPVPEPGPAASPEARFELARLFQSLRHGAEAMRHDLARNGTEALPEAVEGLLGRLSERAEGMDGLAEAWPEVPELLTEARDLALLVQMEGGASQATEAARLLGQVRRDMEGLLAA